MANSYNGGDPADRREALKGAVDYTKLLTTLATGTVVLTATFLGQFYSGHHIGRLIASWIVLGASVLAGLVAFGEYVSQFAESTLKVRRGTMEAANLLQWVLLAVGVGLFASFAISNITAPTTVDVARYESGFKDGRARTVLKCPDSAAHGCSGTVQFSLLTPSHRGGFDLGTALFAADRPGLIAVSSPRPLPGSRRRSLASDRLRIAVHTDGRFGGGQDFDETVLAARPGSAARRR